MNSRKLKITLATGCLLCALVAARFQLYLDGSEFSGGTVTGPLLTANLVGCVFFLLAFAVCFLRSRTAAVVAIVASMLEAPLFVYDTFPRFFRWIVPGNYSVPIEAFGWAPWSIAGLVFIALIVAVSSRALIRRGER